MDFTFGELELSFRDSVRDLLGRLGGPGHVRQAWSAPPGQGTRDLWQALAGMGLTMALVSEEDGGLGLDERAVVLVLEECGRAALPEPLVETMALAPRLAATGAGFTSDTMVAVGLGPEPLVPWAADADLIVTDADDGSWVALPRDRVEIVPQATVDGGRRMGRIRGWGGSPSVALAADGAERERAVRRLTFGAAAQLAGLAQAMLDQAVSHVSQREQFGVPVGSFQAVKHHLAGAATRLEMARPVVYRAAWSLATGGPEASRDVSMAKAMAGDAATVAARTSLQCHGAIGYTTEHDLHLFLKRAWALGRSWGDPSYHRARVGDWLGV